MKTWTSPALVLLPVAAIQTVRYFHYDSYEQNFQQLCRKFVSEKNFLSISNLYIYQDVRYVPNLPSGYDGPKALRNPKFLDLKDPYVVSSKNNLWNNESWVRMHMKDKFLMRYFLDLYKGLLFGNFLIQGFQTPPPNFYYNIVDLSEKILIFFTVTAKLLPEHILG